MKMRDKKINNNKSSHIYSVKLKSHLILIAVFLLITTILSSVLYAEELIDKQGRVVYEVTKPTAETTVDPNTISDALRYVPKANTDYTQGKYKDYTGPSKNIFSKDTIYSSTEWSWKENNEWTQIRHTPSITDVDEDRYELQNDIKKDRMRLTIIISGFGKIEAKNGFYRIKGKTYYFDEDGLMVLGPAYDTIGNYYFFSYETGELLEEVQVK